MSERLSYFALCVLQDAHPFILHKYCYFLIDFDSFLIPDHILFTFLIWWISCSTCQRLHQFFWIVFRFVEQHWWKHQPGIQMLLFWLVFQCNSPLLACRLLVLLLCRDVWGLYLEDNVFLQSKFHTSLLWIQFEGFHLFQLEHVVL